MDINNYRKERELLNRRFKPIYEPVFEGVKRCLICGFAEEKLDRNQHLSYHAGFITAKVSFGEDVLTFQEIRESKKKLEELIVSLKKLEDEKEILIKTEEILELVYSLEFNYSLRTWDYGRAGIIEENYHPDKEEYIELLWNTKEFIRKIKKYISSEIILEKLTLLKGGNKLKSCRFIFDDSFSHISTENKSDINAELIEEIKLGGDLYKKYNNPYFKETQIMVGNLKNLIVA